MGNYEGKLEKLISKCHDDIAAYTKTYYTSVKQGNGMVDVVIFVNIPIKELTDNDVCCLADYVNSL